MKTRIIVVLDESGSMFTLAQDTIGGFNTFLREQRAMGLPDDTLRLVRFNHQVRSDSGEMSLDIFPDLVDYSPMGGTALVDALYEALEGVSPATSERILVLVQTDGEENSSANHTLAELRTLVDAYVASGAWTFVFMGAGLDAFKQANSTLGPANVSARNTLSYAANAVATQSAWANTSASGVAFRIAALRQSQSFYGESKKRQRKKDTSG